MDIQEQLNQASFKEIDRLTDGTAAKGQRKRDKGTVSASQK
ncbi:hypothetical protein J2S74_000893 [Evansella vedderi]|uniref:Uncharacterized protein n=1 Tax=Evansella vedderi TaxID=38282 RepID=A0ABT9ZQK4_9BACI|nr:hypothetical protein [Evansella vedderi]MDQ0253521.1 hypothetical protein [Evansella vedderi]